MKKIITLCLLAFIGTTTLNAQTIWNDGSLTFTKTSPGQFEAMTSQTHITRGSSRPLYNSVTESSANNDQCWNPGNTEWAEGNIDDWNTLTYSTIGNVVGGCGFSNISNRPYVLHLISENIYLQITFTYWQQGGGDFTYTRTTHTGCFTKSKTSASICLGQSYSFNGSTYTTAGTYTKTLTNAVGCDSIAKLILSVLATPNTTILGSRTGCPNVQLQAVTYVPGIKFDYYDNFTQIGLPNFNLLTPTTTGYTNKCNIDATSRTGDNFTFRYTGKVNIPTTGTYTFYTTSDDGSNLKIDGNTVVNNDFLQGATERSGSVTLTAGYHDIEVGFYEHNGGEVLQAHIQGPGISKVELSGDNYLVYEGTSNYVWSTGSNPTASLNTISTSGNHTLTTTFLNGCSSINNFTVTAGLPAITGSNAVCAGSTTTLSNAVSGGVWSTQATSQATVNAATGLVTGKNAGTITIQYSRIGCGSVTKTLIVNPIPVVPTITYAPGTSNPQAGAPTGGFCIGKVFTVVGTPNVPAGLWSATGFASITSSGVVSVNGIGSGSIKYTYTSSAGCSNSRTMVGTGYVCASRGVSMNNEQLAISNDFSIYPNPAKSRFSLNVETLVGAGSIVVTDLYGKVVKTQSLSMGNNTIDIANLTKGFYLVSVMTSEGKTTKKLVVE